MRERKNEPLFVPTLFSRKKEELINTILRFTKIGKGLYMKRRLPVVFIMMIGIAPIVFGWGAAVAAPLATDVVTPKDTIQYTFAEAKLTLGTTSFQIATSDTADVYFSTVIYSDGCIAGVYSEEDVAPFGACLRIGTTWVDAIRYDLVVSDSNYVYYAEAAMVGTDSILYLITATSRTLVPQSHVDIVIDNMHIEDETKTQGFFEIQGSDAQYAVMVRVQAGVMQAGVYQNHTTATISVSGGVAVNSRLVKMTWVETGATVEILGENAVLYRVQMSARATSLSTDLAPQNGNQKYIREGRVMIESQDKHYSTTGQSL